MATFAEHAKSLSVTDAIASMLGARISILATPEVVSFETKQSSVRLAPFVVLSTDGKPRILAAGKEIAVSGPSTRVNLFDPNSLPTTNPSKIECLEAFMRIGIERLLGRRVLLRPHLEIRVSPELARALCGYERVVFVAAAITAGARSCDISAA